MSLALAEFADKLVSVSDFSQGKAGRIFNDVAEFYKEYIVLKNNQPTAVVVSIESYKETQKKVGQELTMLVSWVISAELTATNVLSWMTEKLYISTTK